MQMRLEKPVFSRTFLWRAALSLSIAACFLFAVLLWLSGGSDTQQAFDSGRRLIILRETHEVQGKKNTIQPPKAEAPKEKPPEEEAPKPKEEPPAAEAPKPDATPEGSAPVNGKVEEKPVDPPAEPAAKDEVAPVPGEELPMSQAPEESDAEEAPATIMPSKHPLPDANETLLEKGDVGMLPVIGGDGTKPWRYYAKPFERKDKQPMIAIIITGLGESRAVTQKALLLPEEFSLSFSPYAKEAASWAATARLTAHEKLVDLPMQPGDYPATDPGPYGLILDKGLQENENRLQWLMSRFAGHVGFVAPGGEVYTHNDEALKVLLQSLGNRGLMLVLSQEPARTETKDILAASTTANITADRIIDEELLDTSIQTRLVALEQLALSRGYAVGVVHATPLSIEQLRLWSDTLAAKGIVLAPISAVVRLRFS